MRQRNPRAAPAAPHLDFVQAVPLRWQRGRWLALCVALLISAVMLLGWQQQQAAIQALQWQLAALATQVTSPPQARDNATLTARLPVLQQLTLPWHTLFQALEQAYSADVLIDQITPDAAQGRVQISGAAQDIDAILAFNARLQRSGVLDRIHLIQESPQLAELDDSSAAAPERADYPLNFTVQAHWLHGQGLSHE